MLLRALNHLKQDSKLHRLRNRGRPRVKSQGSEARFDIQRQVERSQSSTVCRVPATITESNRELGPVTGRHQDRCVHKLRKLQDINLVFKIVTIFYFYLSLAPNSMWCRLFVMVNFIYYINGSLHVMNKSFRL